MLAPTLTVLSLFSTVGLCKLYENVAELPTLQYDFVIVGGGTAGNVLASRLTENNKVSVLVLEAGPTWNYTTTPQVGANGVAFPFLRGYMLGGCSAHNGLAYTRGAASDFDRYANLTGDDGWSWNNMLPYFLKNEKWSAPADNHDTKGQFNPAFHGTQGPIDVSVRGYPWSEFEGHVLQTTKELSEEFPFQEDYNAGTPLGIGWMQFTIGGGQRSSSATGYLTSSVLSRPNLHVLLHAQVSKLVNPVQSRVAPSEPLTFQGVQFRFGNSLFVANATKEIILSAGPVGSPSILQHSGVGDATILKRLGIPTVLNLPSVGKNASEHAYSGLSWAVNSNQTVESLFQNPALYDQAFAQWNKTKTGPFVDTSPGTMVGWLRLAPDSPAFKVHADPSPGPDAPHFEVLFQPFGLDIFGPGPYSPTISLVLAMVSPVSRGSVLINSTDPFSAPLIDPGLLSNDFDALAMAEGLQLLLKFVGAPNWKENRYLGAPSVDIASMTPDEVVAYVRGASGPGYHLVGTLGMSPQGAPYGCVDPDLKVKGFAGLRVVDASVLPIVPAAHTQAATYVVAERAADLIKQQWGL
ncbi:alcohol oxidase [Roridomyces roridus]|uniref:Alcohol oxidase n=1 Tax=Roridomyces roridus TaxID=1738132 RepID=A0AAD7F956_9AGAR|nr:alcohol oxidase [Roridomyces roridus]